MYCCIPLHPRVARVKLACHHPASNIRGGRITGRREWNVEKGAGWGWCNCLRKTKRGSTHGNSFRCVSIVVLFIAVIPVTTTF
jgi:hypothetical protein